MEELTPLQHVQLGCAIVTGLVFLFLVAVNAKNIQWDASECPETVIVLGVAFSAAIGWFFWQIVLAVVIVFVIGAWIYFGRKKLESRAEVIDAAEVAPLELPRFEPRQAEPDWQEQMEDEIDDIIREGNERGFPQEVIDEEIQRVEKKYAHGSNR